MTIQDNSVKSALSMPRQKALNTRQLKFIKLLVQGESMAQAHRRAGYSCPTIEGHGANAIRLLKSERIQQELKKLKDKQFAKDALTYNEKRSFLSRVVRADPSKADPDLIQEVREEVDHQGNVKRVVKLVNKLDALREDNAMSGDRFSDRQPQASNPFLFLVTAFKEQVDVLQQGERVALPAPAKAKVVDAELVE